MLTESQQARNKKAKRAVANQKATRIRAAARLSRDTQPAEICLALGISAATLKRYAKDSRWKQNGGVDLPRYFFEKPTGRRRDITKEKQLLAEANCLHADGMTWKAVAEKMGLKIRQLEHLRSKYPV